MSSPPVKPIDLAAVVPGGIWPTDHMHDPGYDETCSRCRTQIAADDVPLSTDRETTGARRVEAGASDDTWHQVGCGRRHIMTKQTRKPKQVVTQPDKTSPPPSRLSDEDARTLVRKLIGPYLKFAIQDPYEKVEDPDKKDEDPDKKVEDPDKKVEDPDKKVEDPDKKVEDPDKKVEQGELLCHLYFDMQPLEAATEAEEFLLSFDPNADCKQMVGDPTEYFLHRAEADYDYWEAVSRIVAQQLREGRRLPDLDSRLAHWLLDVLEFRVSPPKKTGGRRARTVRHRNEVIREYLLILTERTPVSKTQAIKILAEMLNLSSEAVREIAHPRGRRRPR